MLVRNRLVVSFIFSAIAILSGCGSGGSIPKVTPPPSGAFSNSNLNGTYVFSIVGNVNSSASDFIAMAGTFIADGSGGITGGALDMNTTAFTSAVTNNPITGGSYT